MVLKPLNDLILLKPDPFTDYNEHKGYKHIILPDQFRHGPEDRNFTGKVLGVGSSCKVKLKKGDKVAWGKWAGAKFTFNRQDYYLVREYDLLGLFERNGSDT